MPSASIEFFNLIEDTACLLPLQDWAPLFKFTMSYSPDSPAPRILHFLTIDILPDLLDRPTIDDGPGPEQQSILEFALFHENFPIEGEHEIVARWRPDGDPIDNYSPHGDFHYEWNLVGDQTVDDPEWFVSNEYFGQYRDHLGGETYTVAVRTSALWYNTMTISYIVPRAQMYIFPVSDDGSPLDSYSPNFFGSPPAYLNDDGLDGKPDTAYLSSFAVWDTTGYPGEEFRPYFANAWNWPTMNYTTLPEHRRPRWDATGTVFDFVAGEWAGFRHVFSLETWVAPIGINIHAIKDFTPGAWQTTADITGWAQLREVNVIFTDVGADPFGPPGNGGFDPREGFEKFSGIWTLSANEDFAVNRDFSFNGVWVYHDTNANGVFDPPVPAATGLGVTVVDFPMIPEGFGIGTNLPQKQFLNDPAIPQWEYIPFPPGGGDPWWKIKLRFGPGRKRHLEETQPTGYIEPIVDGTAGEIADPGFHGTWFTSEFNDYYVVFRSDSGYADIAGWPGDGVGLTLGADMRVFIEPRRFNPVTGHEDGGIYTDAQVPYDSDIVDGIIMSAWEDDALWGAGEPWWNQRTLNPNNTKPVRSAVEVHDLVMTYESDNAFSKSTAINYARGFTLGRAGFWTYFDWWLDPFGLLASQFAEFHTVGVVRWLTQADGVTDHWLNFLGIQYPFETVPFFDPVFDAFPYGPRSFVFVRPPDQPTLPIYDTWPPTLPPGQYPRITDWEPQFRRARYLKQHVESNSRATAMLGFNLAGANDRIVNAANRLWLQQITVAFWGPDFTPDDLLELDPDGTDENSGIQVAEDTDRNGIYGVTPGGFEGTDNTLPLNDLAWADSAEPVDLDGDGVADDLNGDGIVDSRDYAWVLRIRFKQAWPVPVEDTAVAAVPPTKSAQAQDNGNAGVAQAMVSAPEDPSAIEAARQNVSAQGVDYWKKRPVRVNADAPSNESSAPKAVGPAGNLGDDLFLTVRTSDLIKRFEQFKAFVPANLPSRPTSGRIAGFQFTPQNRISQGAYTKQHPEETVVQEFYGNEMLEANVPCEITDLTGRDQTINPGGDPLAILGIDLSTNRGSAGAAASGTQGFGNQRADGTPTFSVQNAGWTNGAFAGYWLIDSHYEAYEITGNNPDTLTLASGTPRNGAWRIVIDPTFLEQLIVEFYDEGRDGGFKLIEDLMPLNHEDPRGEDSRFVNNQGQPTKPISGVALYRDNDFDPFNRNGIFDLDIDIPVPLDYPPYLIGMVGEPDTQVLFVFSSPGTDNIPLPRNQQARRRQWIPDGFGQTVRDPDNGPDFFVVIRPSEDMNVNDDFRAAIVSWGPSTPTEPDPDTFPPPPAAPLGSFDLFSEFAWGERAVGLISYFNKSPYYKQYPEVDNSGFNWVRSTVNKARQSHVIRAVAQVRQPDDVIIASVAPSTLPRQNPNEDITLAISGSAFGLAPTAVLDGISLRVNSSTGSFIDAALPAGQTLDADRDGVVVLTVTNPTTGKSGTYNRIALSDLDASLLPRITAVTPDTGGPNNFPVSIFGVNFGDPTKGETVPVVSFGGTEMPVLDGWTDTQVQVAFPAGGLPATGPLDVTVRNSNTNLAAIAVGAFSFVNPPAQCFIATAAYGSPFEKHLGALRSFRDDVLLKTALGAALVDCYYTYSPPLADQVAQHAWLAALVRVVLTPVAWFIEHPESVLGLLMAIAVGVGLLRNSVNRRVGVLDLMRGG